jgi:hypothetical protein
MERVVSRKNFRYYTFLKRILFDLEIANKEYWWLISDIEAYPSQKEYEKIIYKEDYLLISTSDLVRMLENDDFQWIWAVFSVIPFHHSKDAILSFPLPYLQDIGARQYNPYEDAPKLQHPLAEFELYAVDSSYLFLVSEDEELLTRFKRCYPQVEKEVTRPKKFSLFNRWKQPSP